MPELALFRLLSARDNPEALVKSVASVEKYFRFPGNSMVLDRLHELRQVCNRILNRRLIISVALSRAWGLCDS